MRHKFSNFHLIFKVKIGKYIERIFNFYNEYAIYIQSNEILI